MMSGHLYGLGVGPGDPELLTLKALRLLRAAPVVAYPAPDTGSSFARAIVAEWLDRGQREIAIRFPMRPGPPPEALYDEAAARLAALLDRGDDIAFLCQGDPLFYGSFAGILRRLVPRYRRLGGFRASCEPGLREPRARACILDELGDAHLNIIPK